MVVASDLYPLVYDFLAKCGHANTLKVFLKDIDRKKKTLVTKEDLLDIYSKYLVIFLIFQLKTKFTVIY
jgi:hypothetical protein